MRVPLLAMGFVLACQLTAMAADGGLLAKLSSARVPTNKEVELQESMAFDANTGVVRMGHTVSRIGIYHRRQKRFIMWNEVPLSTVFPVSEVIRGLPDSFASTGGFPLKDVGGGARGRVFHFRAIEPGIYVIETQWMLRQRNANGVTAVKSNPVILFVEPSANFEEEAKAREGEFEGLALQRRLEEAFDAADKSAGVLVLPEFEALR